MDVRKAMETFKIERTGNGRWTVTEDDTWVINKIITSFTEAISIVRNIFLNSKK